MRGIFMVANSDALKQVAEEMISARKSSEEGSAVDASRIREIVAKDPDAVAGAFPLMIRSSEASGFRIWGLLTVVAETYKFVTEGDDSLVLMLDEAMSRAGVERPKARITETPCGGTGTAVPIVLQMAAEDVKAGSAYRMARFLSLKGMDTEVREKLLGRCIITFPVDEDPRPIWHISEVRNFVADLHRKLPYFPIYLNLDPRLNQHLTYFGCLADEAALQPQGPLTRLDLANPSVIECIRESAQAIRAACKENEIPCKPILESLLGIYPIEQRHALFRAELTE
jgi:hypothetical protein